MIDTFRNSLQKLVYPVSVISGVINGKNFAITISSLTSISFDPPSVLACINKDSSFTKFIDVDVNVNINLLNSNQKNISNLCSNPNEIKNRFKNDIWTYDDKFGPYLAKSQSIFFSKIDDLYSYGTHFIIVMKVLKVMNSSKIADPLLYGNQKYLNKITL